MSGNCNKKVVAVIGALGNQGGAVACALLQDGEFDVRALTRDPLSPKAHALKKLGASIVQATITDVDSLSKAIEGCYGLFCVTYAPPDLNPEIERQQGLTFSKAAKLSSIQHVVWSTSIDTRKLCPLDDNRMPTILGKYKVPQMDVKAEIDECFLDLDVPTTFLIASSFWDKIPTILRRSQDGGSLTLRSVLPMDTRLFGVSLEDFGKCAVGAFKKPGEFIGKRIGIVSEALTLSETAEKLSKAIGQNVVPISVSPEDFRKMGFPGCGQLANMYQFFRDFEDYLAPVFDLSEVRKLNTDMLTFDQWTSKSMNDGGLLQ